MKPFVIVNPTAGGGISRSRLRELVGRWLPDARVQMTSGPGSAAELAARARSEGHELIVAAGGDGHVNEVVNGLAPEFAGLRLGLLPLGTGNDLARSLAIPRRPESAARLLHGTGVRRLDLVRIRELATESGSATARTPPQTRFGVNVTVAGFGARIELDGRTRRQWKRLGYLRGALLALPQLRAQETTIVLDSEERVRLDALMIAVANGAYMGGGIPIAPGAAPDDGWLDLVAVPAMPAPILASLVPRILLGKHSRSARLLVRRTRTVTLASSSPLWLNVDGEVFGDRPVRFEIVPGVLEVVAPPAQSSERGRSG